MADQTILQGVQRAPTAEWAEARPLALRISDGLRHGIDFVGRWGAWLVIPLVVITGIDVIARKIVWHTADGGVAGGGVEEVSLVPAKVGGVGGEALQFAGDLAGLAEDEEFHLPVIL